MVRYKIIYLLLLACIVYVASAEEERKAEDRISTTSLNLKPPDKLILQKSQPYNNNNNASKKEETSSFMSRIASWIFPFGGSSSTTEDSIAAEDYGGPQYLPPPNHQNQGCNPCNKSPWIPMASNVRGNTLINFVPPPSSHLNPQYGAPVFRPKPEKINYGLAKPPNADYYNKIEFLRPPLPPPRPPHTTTHLKPVSAPIGMLPPPVKGGIYHSIPPGPTDSYGAPVTGINANYHIKQEYLPPLNEQVPLSTDHFTGPALPFPNLNSYPVLPIHNAQNFHRDSLQQSGINHEVNLNQNVDVQVIPSVNVADFVSSIEHPINVIQSPLVDLNVKSENLPETSDVDNIKPGGFYGNDARLSENPIVVDEDTHPAASAALNVTYQAQESRAESTNNILNSDFIKNILDKEVFNVNNKSFTPPSMDYSNWKPTIINHQLSTSMLPPRVHHYQSTWITSTTTKPTKQVQIIIPYITSKKPVGFDKGYYSTLVPVFMPPSSTEQSLWSKFNNDFIKYEETQKILATVKPSTTTQVYNIRDLLKDTKGFHSNLPYDVISLQNHIDDWTQQEYSSKAISYSDNSNKFGSSKKIPNEYFTTQPYHETTTVLNNFDHEPASSDKKETQKDIESNLIESDSTTISDDLITTTTTTEATTAKKDVKSLWDLNNVVTVSPITKEKIYIVTPLPYNYKTSTPITAWSLPPKIGVKSESSATPKFLVRVDPENKESREKLISHNSSPLTVVFSEWPHLINNLQTTTTTTTPKTTTSRHPLFGLMDLSSYTPPPNATIQTFSGHSKVVTVVTPAPTNK